MWRSSNLLKAFTSEADKNYEIILLTDVSFVLGSKYCEFITEYMNLLDLEYNVTTSVKTSKTIREIELHVIVLIIETQTRWTLVFTSEIQFKTEICFITQKWLTAVVVPLFKKRCKHNPSNYRLIGVVTEAWKNNGQFT